MTHYYAKDYEMGWDDVCNNICYHDLGKGYTCEHWCRLNEHCLLDNPSIGENWVEVKS